MCLQTLNNAMLESNCSEQASRMSAMESSTKNAKEMLAKLTLSYNRCAFASGLCVSANSHLSGLGHKVAHAPLCHCVLAYAHVELLSLGLHMPCLPVCSCNTALYPIFTWAKSVAVQLRDHVNNKMSHKRDCDSLQDAAGSHHNRAHRDHLRSCCAGGMRDGWIA